MAGQQGSKPLRNRNKEIRKVKVADILDHPQNARRHPDTQVDAFGGAVDEIGWYNYPDVFEPPDQPGKVMLADGHLRRAWLEQHYGVDVEIEVNVTDFTPEDAQKAMLTKDPLAAMAETDIAALEALEADVEIANEALRQMVDDLKEEAGIEPPDFFPTSEDEQPRLDEKAPIKCPECGAEFVPQ